MTQSLGVGIRDSHTSATTGELNNNTGFYLNKQARVENLLLLASNSYRDLGINRSVTMHG